MREFIDLLNENMSRSEALDVFASHGINARTFDEKQLKKARNRLAMQMHADDQTGTAHNDTAAMLNAAYDELLADVRSRTAGSAFDARPGESPKASPAPARKDFTDLRHVQQYFREHAGPHARRYTVWNFDGTFFRGCFTVDGDPALFHEMAHAMIVWDRFYEHRAIFIQNEHDAHALNLVFLDGEYLAHPVVMEHDSFNMNPGNDQHFCRELPGLLDRQSRMGIPAMPPRMDGYEQPGAGF